MKISTLLFAGIFACNILTAFAEIKPDLTVATDGSGDFKTIQAAVASISKTNHERTVIFINDGVYHEKIRIDAPYVTLRGQSRANTRIEFPQGMDEFTNRPDAFGRAVVNINADDVVLENLTVKNTHGVIGPHAFAVYGQGDKTVILDSDILSDGADTLAIWSRTGGGSYVARVNLRGSVDFVCPRGWSYMTGCTFYQVNPQANAAIWHDGAKDKDMKFVLRDCQFDGAGNWILARHHHDAQFYLFDCTFSKAMRDLPPKRVIYPLDGSKPSEADIKKNRSLDPENIWGERNYFYNCHRAGGDYDWFTNNLATAPGSPTPAQITAAWTFAGKWNPENKTGPSVQKVIQTNGQIEVVFNESVTVKGKPRLILKSGSAPYSSGSGSDTLVFIAPAGSSEKIDRLDVQDGTIIATSAAAAVRVADMSAFARSSVNSDANHPADKTPPPARTNALPVLFIVGDSTVHNEAPGVFGWGDVIGPSFDPARISVENHAHPGRSTRTFMSQGWWQQILDAARPGDFVIIQMGHNDSSPLNDTNRARGTLPGIGPESTNLVNALSHQPETVYTYGGYLRRYIAEARVKGMTPILCTPVSRLPQPGKELDTTRYSAWVRSLAAMENVPVIDLNRRELEHWENKSSDEIFRTYFAQKDTTHFNRAGAELNAACAVDGIRSLANCPLKDFLISAEK